MIDMISDILGTLTDTKTHLKLMKEYFNENGVKAIMELDGVSETEARKRFEEFQSHSDKADPEFRTKYAPAVYRAAEVGYKNGELSLESAIKPEAEEVFRHVKDEGGRIALVGLSHPEGTKASLETVDLDKYVDSYYQSDEAGKVTGEIYKTIAAKEGFELPKTIYADDKLEQAEGAHKVGVGKAIWVRNNEEMQETPCEVVEDFGEVAGHYDALKEET